MSGVSIKYLTICGILLFSLVYADEERGNEPIVVYLDLIQNEDQITVVGEITSAKDITGATVRVYIFRSDMSLLCTLLEATANLQATTAVTLEELNNGADIVFSME
ncbi:MAG: hypothetical protein HXS44_14160 [Theionarchaea archaeon]|nr:hypothetical protein [Theionarchaea archaeon]